jgi:hypothetical protein
MSSEHWRAVGDAVESLGQKLKTHFEQTKETPEAEPAAGEASGSGTSGGSGSSGATDALRKAVDELGETLERSFDALRAAAKDDAIRTDLREVATKLKEAVTESLPSRKRDGGSGTGDGETSSS